MPPTPPTLVSPPSGSSTSVAKKTGASIEICALSALLLHKTMSKRRAEKIGSLLFCPDCGTLLNLPRDDENEVACEQCGHVEPASSYENITVVTRSHPDAFPSALRQKGKTQTKVHDSEAALLLVTEKCPSCGHMEAYSKEMQLRSADEGSTILYTCAKCKHGWRVNN